MSFLNELRRRNVLRVGAAYIVGSWLLIQVAETIFPLFGFDDSPARIVVIALAIGFIPALIFSWAFEITPEGLKKEADVDHGGAIALAATKRLDRIVLFVLALAVGYFAFDKFVLDPARDHSSVEKARQEGRTEALVESYGDKSIAVLPFIDMSANKDQEYMSDGIAEELLNLLAKIPDLRVISRSSAFAFKGKDIDIRSVAEKLDVAYVLEGSVRKAGQQLRITAQLIEARSDTHLWSETYDRDLINVFEIQDQISAAIIAALKIKLLGGVGSQSASGHFVNADAYDAYLIGNERLALLIDEDIKAARAQFEKAIDIEPEFAAAHVQLAYSLLLLEQQRIGNEKLDSEDIDATVTAHLDRALKSVPDLPEAFGVRGYNHIRRGRYAKARDALDRAISLNPNYALAYNWRAITARQQKRYLDLLADREKAFSLDPMSFQISLNLASDYRDFWRPKDAERVINRMFSRYPDHPRAYKAAQMNLGMHGRHAEAQLMAEKALAAHPDNEEFKQGLSIGLFFMRFFEEVEALNSDNLQFRAYLADRRFDEAKALLDKHQEEFPGTWLTNAREYYRVIGRGGNLESFADAVQQYIAFFDRRNVRWYDRCNVDLIYDLRETGIRMDAVDSMMSACRTEFEERRNANYLCPCNLQTLVYYLILDGRIDEAIEQGDEWLASGWSDVSLETEPIFALLSDRPEYLDFLERNAAQIERQRRIYLARKQE